jgi:3'-phosphoadenosine 5'-phosphosulfate sulfotransferase (PAPS reductase)/FAD synthetase
MKVKQALDFISDKLKEASDPIIMCSFGKDSMAMLHLIRKVRKDVPVLQWRVRSKTKKYEFADDIITKWNLRMNDYGSASWDVVYNNGKIDVYSTKRVSDNYYFIVANETIPSGNGNCVILDFFLDRPNTDYEYKWDVSFSGHKSCDVDPLMGAVPLKDYEVKIGSTKVVFPLKDWSDKEIWQYIEENNVPFNMKRYNKDNGYREFEDKSYNENYHFTCTDCFNPENPKEVYCPALSSRIRNLSGTMNYEEKIKYYKSLAPYIRYEE